MLQLNDNSKESSTDEATEGETVSSVDAGLAIIHE